MYCIKFIFQLLEALNLLSVFNNLYVSNNKYISLLFKFQSNFKGITIAYQCISCL